ncbi:hypothetical protein PRV_02170 [Mycoplasma parvum str. Indiana]|uniref:Uncharacterized protein n=2 Tax=Mycoplasma parvum TaxID=984991 RepID=U5NCM0_9MOLU|nr:hypothetical protein PRV_02170 [Mycoplasma parvum str. Indiana]
MALMLIWKDYKKMSYREFGNYLIKGSYFITGYSYFLQNIKKIPLSLNLFISQMPIWKKWKSIDKSTPLKSTSEINLFNKNKKTKKRAEQISNIFKK